MNVTDLWDSDIRQAVTLVEGRLPWDARAALAHVRVTAAPMVDRYADAGVTDIRIRPNLVCSTAALLGILGHEAAHVALDHARHLRAGTKSADVCEAEADALCRTWGFGPELAARRFFYGH